MSNILPFQPKTAASKARVDEMAKTVVASLNRQQAIDEAKEEKSRQRTMVLAELDLVIRKAFAILGKVDAEFAVSLAYETVRKEK